MGCEGCEGCGGKSLLSHNGKGSWGDLGVKEAEALCMLDHTLKQAKPISHCCVQVHNLSLYK